MAGSETSGFGGFDLMVDDRWQAIDLPVLRAIYEAGEAVVPGRDIDGNKIRDSLGLTHQTFIRSVGFLNDARFVDVIDASSMSGGDFLIKGVTAAGLLKLGAWPTDDKYAEILPQLLRGVAEEIESDQDDNAALFRRGADVLQGVAVGTITALIRSLTGM